MKQFLTEADQVSDSNKDIYYSTRYDDRELIKGDTEQAKLDWLSLKIFNEITEAGISIIKLERLEERYQSDSVAARNDDNMGYEMRYIAGIERIQTIVGSFYRAFNPVSDEGKQQ